MSELSRTVARGLAGHLERTRRRVHELVEPLTPEQLWRRPYPYGNSVGHLLRHLTGNLSYYIGTQIAGTGYVRDRPREFTDTSRAPLDELLAAFDAAVAMVLATLERQSEADWSAAYQAVGEEDAGDRFNAVLRCVAHADHHLGQLVYLGQELARG